MLKSEQIMGYGLILLRLDTSSSSQYILYKHDVSLIIAIKQCWPVIKLNFVYPIPTLSGDQNVIFPEGNSIQYIFGASSLLCWPNVGEV